MHLAFPHTLLLSVLPHASFVIALLAPTVHGRSRHITQMDAQRFLAMDANFVSSPQTSDGQQWCDDEAPGCAYQLLSSRNIKMALVKEGRGEEWEENKVEMGFKWLSRKESR